MLGAGRYMQEQNYTLHVNTITLKIKVDIVWSLHRVTTLWKTEDEGRRKKGESGRQPQRKNEGVFLVCPDQEC